MNAFTSRDRNLIGATLLLAGLLSLACIVVGMFGVNFDLEAFSNPLKLLDFRDVNAGLIRWFLILDLFGYYLLLVPFLFYAHSQLKTTTPWHGMITSLGYSYVLVGSIGASTLATIWPSILEDYQGGHASPEVLRATFTLASQFVVEGLWNTLEVLLGGVWWLALAKFLPQSRALKLTTAALGSACLLDGFGELLAIPLLAELGLNVYLVLGIAWPIWMGIAVIRQTIGSQNSPDITVSYSI